MLIQTQNKETGKKPAQTRQMSTPARKKEAFTEIHDVRHERRELWKTVACFLALGGGIRTDKGLRHRKHGEPEYEAERGLKGRRILKRGWFANMAGGLTDTSSAFEFA